MRTRKPPALRYRVEPLEPRLLLAADWAAGLAPQWSPEPESPPSDIDLLVSLSAPGESGAEPGQVHGVVSELPPALDLEALRRLGEVSDSDAELPGSELGPAARSSSDAGPHELVVIDASVADYEQLLADLQSARDDLRQIEVLLLDGHRDGVEQISEALADRKSVV